jgi:hypothetical protein
METNGLQAGIILVKFDYKSVTIPMIHKARAFVKRFFQFITRLLQTNFPDRFSGAQQALLRRARRLFPRGFQTHIARRPLALRRVFRQKARGKQPASAVQAPESLVPPMNPPLQRAARSAARKRVYVQHKKLPSAAVAAIQIPCGASAAFGCVPP